jgi:hypothetical protein
LSGSGISGHVCPFVVFLVCTSIILMGTSILTRGVPLFLGIAVCVVSFLISARPYCAGVKERKIKILA